VTSRFFLEKNPSMSRAKCLFIDAMGVLYALGDDVGDLLIPFCLEKGSACGGENILQAYQDCSLGKMSSGGLWKRLGFLNNWDEEYIQRYSLNPDVLETLALLKKSGFKLYCLSNDVAEWSRLLRKRFSLKGFFEGWIVSGEVGVRKPDPEIYELVLEKSGCDPGDCLFIDDRIQNLKPALEKGMKVLKFGYHFDAENPNIPQAASFHAISLFLND